ncbi:hypothetical protein [Marinobacter zhanjiangensis]|uniref:Cutinase n=1 Tax=Marinobacter zhanjiangensis TaxID=578215 RepID=A0ABQ3B7K0_9GAMM|nr:hypothetical protein [Marinobacter zhanjiangensis]GGY82984.1 hypothetical protein GCM10007071_33090 [Marinobacter zhanjiangensis]
MKISNKLKLAGISAALVSGLFMSGSALAIGGGGGGACSVDTERGSGARFFVPSGGDGNYNILGWGNGTGGSVTVYSGLLESVAEQCILVAAATTSQSGSGRDVASAVNQAKSRYSNIVGSDPKVCTSGHSQGGGGSFNAANRLDADCVIAVQPDTVFTTRIDRPVSSDTDVVCIFSTGDVLAPALPSNGRNCRNNSTRYTQELTSGTHFAPTTGDGGAVGDVMREYSERWLVN